MELSRLQVSFVSSIFMHYRTTYTDTFVGKWYIKVDITFYYIVAKNYYIKSDFVLFLTAMMNFSTVHCQQHLIALSRSCCIPTICCFMKLHIKWFPLLSATHFEQVGDASGIQSPVSFGGFGSMTRHLSRLSTGMFSWCYIGSCINFKIFKCISYSDNLSIVGRLVTFPVEPSRAFHPQ